MLVGGNEAIMNGDEDGDPAVGDIGGLNGWADQMAAESAQFRFACGTLVTAGCDRLNLAWLMSSLTNATGLQPLAVERIREIVHDLDVTAAAVRTLFFSQIGLLVGLTSLRLEGELRELARRARELEPTVHGRRPMGRDLGRATLVHYVHETTGQWHDDRVAELISVAESLAQRGVDLAGGVRDPEREYTTEAHIQWRNRNACQNFLNGPSPELRDRQTAMNDAVERERRILARAAENQRAV